MRARKSTLIRTLTLILSLTVRGEEADAGGGGGPHRWGGRGGACGRESQAEACAT
jgi:hypothetical protein